MINTNDCAGIVCCAELLMSLVHVFSFTGIWQVTFGGDCLFCIKNLGCARKWCWIGCRYVLWGLVGISRRSCEMLFWQFCGVWLEQNSHVFCCASFGLGQSNLFSVSMGYGGWGF